MLAVEQYFGVCIKKIISNKPYGAKLVRKSGEYYDIIMTFTTLLNPSVTYISYWYLIILISKEFIAVEGFIIFEKGRDAMVAS